MFGRDPDGCRPDRIGKLRQAPPGGDCSWPFFTRGARRDQHLAAIGRTSCPGSSGSRSRGLPHGIRRSRGAKALQETAEALGTRIYQQPGLRIGVVVTDESTAIFSPTPLLIEAGGKPGEKPNAIRLDTPILNPEKGGSVSDLHNINVEPQPLTKKEVEKTSEDFKLNPPMKFDVARKVRVFNARIEFADLTCPRFSYQS